MLNISVLSLNPILNVKRYPRASWGVSVLRTRVLSEALEDDADETRKEDRYWISLLAGPASGNVPPRVDLTTEFPAIAEAA